MPYIEQGERDFSFRFVFGDKEELLRTASRVGHQFNMTPMLLSFYPTGIGTLPAASVRLESTDAVVMTAFKQAQDGCGYIIRLFNPTAQPQTAQLCCMGVEADLSFGPWEIKSLRVCDGMLSETDLMEGLINKKQ